MEKHEYYKIQILCGLLYMFCLFNLSGIPLHRTDGLLRDRRVMAAKEQTASDKGGESPQIAITFDDGPNRHCTGRLLDGLKERGVKASFFLIGRYASENPELVKRLDEEGHLIGNHTYNHAKLTDLPDEKAKQELLDTDTEICSVTGKHVEYMRPPFGLWPEKLEEELDMMPVMWSIDPLDWTTKNTDQIVNKVVTEAGDRDIILLHDCYDSSVDAAFRIIDILQKQGFEFVTVDRLLIE